MVTEKRIIEPIYVSLDLQVVAELMLVFQDLDLRLDKLRVPQITCSCGSTVKQDLGTYGNQKLPF